MKISLNWLKKFIEISENPEDLESILTEVGLEVDEIISFEPDKDFLSLMKSFLLLTIEYFVSLRSDWVKSSSIIESNSNSLKKLLSCWLFEEEILNWLKLKI